MRPWLMIGLVACAPPTDQFLVYTYENDAHVVAPVEIPTLTDAVRLAGEEGEGRAGGSFRFEADPVNPYSATVTYRPGPPVRVGLAVDAAGVSVPTDEQSLVMLSFYHQLANARVELGAIGIDVEPVFPMNAIAYLPSLPGDSFSFENAAYAGGDAHCFVLFPDLGDAVPLAANRAIVRHEFGHALFAHLTGERTAGMFDRAFNEGFADGVAALSLDRAHFLDDSLPLPERYVDGLAVVTDEVLSAVESNPYALGTVFASFLWDLRVHDGDAHRVLTLVTDAVVGWGEAYPPFEGGESSEREAQKSFALVDAVIDAYGSTPARRDFACTAAALRFGRLDGWQPCS